MSNHKNNLLIHLVINGKKNVFHFVSEKSVCSLCPEPKLFHLHLVELGDNLMFICFFSSDWVILIN